MSTPEAELRIDRTASGETRVQVGRYSLFTRLNHWTLAVSFVLLSLSGAALFHPSLFWLSALFGGGATMRWLHPVIGVVLIVAWVVMFLRYFVHNLPNSTDIAWVRASRAILAGDEEKVPEVGRYNAGQKVVFWAFALLVPGLFVSGILMWDEYTYAWTTIEEKRVAVLAHAVLAVAMIGIWIIHAYAAIWVRGTLQAMSKGWVTGGWAFRHHRKWLRDVAQGQRGKPSAAAE